MDQRFENAFAVPPPMAEPVPTTDFRERTEARSLLRGDDAPLAKRGIGALFEALLKHPANVMYEVREGRSMTWKLAAIVISTMAIAGLVVAASAGGAQLLVVPLKASLGMVLCALICLPSLYIFVALSGTDVSLRETFGALLLGVAVSGVLLVAFAPVSWVFTQATESTSVLGGLHLAFLFISAFIGMRVTRRALLARAQRTVPAIGLWMVLFLLVVLQMTTTLRPLVGPYDGLAFAPREFFLVHWFS